MVSEVVHAAGIELEAGRSAAIALALDDIIRQHRIVDWTRNEDVKKRMEQALEDHLYNLRDQGLELGFDVIEQVYSGVLRIAEARYA